MVDAQDAIHRTEEIRVISKMSSGQVLAFDHRSETASVRASCGPRIMRVNVAYVKVMGNGRMLSSHQVGCKGKVINGDVMTRDFLVPNRYGLIGCNATREVLFSMAILAAHKLLPLVRSRSRVSSTV